MNIISMAPTEINWYIFYTKPRAEKKIQLELVNRNYEVFLPATKNLSVWKNGQQKWIYTVLFPNYIFVKTYASELYYITRVPKIVTCINCAGKPSIISSKEVEGIKGILNLGKKITVETKFIRGERVKIVRGPLVGYEGILVEQNGKTRFGIQLEEINHTIFVDIRINQLEKK